LEWFTLKIRSFSALLASGLLLATATLALSGCYVEVLYKTPQYGYAGRPVPPSKLLERVLASYTANGTSGGLEIIDGLRDLRGNIQNTVRGFSVSGYSEAQPTTIFNFPEQTLGYVLSATDGTLTAINYSTEAGSGTAANFGGFPPSAAAAPVGGLFAGAAQQAGVLVISSGGSTFDLNLPNVNKVAINNGSSIVLAMVKNSNSLYRVVKLPSTTNPVNPPGAIDCEPVLLPVFCVVPVAGTYDRPADVSFSLDGSTAYRLKLRPRERRQYRQCHVPPDLGTQYQRHPHGERSLAPLELARTQSHCHPGRSDRRPLQRQLSLSLRTKVTDDRPLQGTLRRET